MKPVLAGIETEYGFTVEGRSVSDQVEDAIEFVRSYPGKAHIGWDYRFESPRSDLQGFKVEHLAYDPVDAEFDQGRARPPAAEERSDRVLTNGARFYNDHGHPEYATPETFSATQSAFHDLAGQEVLLLAARALETKIGKKVQVFKNNTDFHGSSYGTHESYCVSRKHSFKALYEAVAPLLIARQVLTAAGKVGAETGGPVRYQISARADFLSEPFNLETLYRRPVFNTRDEPHADPKEWIRLHVISGDANMMPACTARKINLVKIAIALLEVEQVPLWRIPDPPRSFKLVSRDVQGEGRIELEGSSWTTPRQVLESYFDAAETHADLDPELLQTIQESRQLLQDRTQNPNEFRRHVDWAAKYWLLDQFRESEGLSWHETQLQSLDLAYHLLDAEEGLYPALVEAGEIAWHPAPDEYLPHIESAPEASRAAVRAHFITHFPESVKAVSWSRITVLVNNTELAIDLPPHLSYPPHVFAGKTVEEAINSLQEYLK